MLNIPSDMSAKPLGKGRGQHGQQRWLATKLPMYSAKQFGQHVFQAFWCPVSLLRLTGAGKAAISRPSTVAVALHAGGRICKLPHSKHVPASLPA